MTSNWILRLERHYPRLAPTIPSILAATSILEEAFLAGNKLLIAGNGGSASDASHIAGELLKGFRSPRRLPEYLRDDFHASHAVYGARLHVGLQRGLPALALNDQTSLVTAWINDAEPEMVYAQLVHALGKPGDVFLGISTSGNARNVVMATVTAEAHGMRTIALTGTPGGEMAHLAETVIAVPETVTADIQELHLPVYHAICSQLEENLFGK
jgi:D-sedoheptulose 7-phosphate isomerase